MTIMLPPDLEQIVNHNLESGRYHSADEVVGASLRLLQAQEALQREVALGIEQADRGQTKPFDAQAIKQRLREAMPGANTQA